MGKHTSGQRLLEIILSVGVALTVLPSIAWAEGSTKTINKQIIAFETLPIKQSQQTVALGTAVDQLDLPDALIATVHISSDETPLDSGEIETDEAEEQAIPVTWQSSPKYRGDTVGEYTFLPILSEDYTMAIGIYPPNMMVTVSEEITPSPLSEITAFNMLETEISEQTMPVGTLLSDLALPELIFATVGEETAEIPVLWTSFPDFDGDLAGTYRFTPAWSEGYSLADGVTPPKITVTIAPLMMALTGTVTSWSTLQSQLNSATSGAVFNFSDLSSPATTYNFNVGSSKTLTLKGNGTQIQNVAFQFGSNNTITIEDLNIITADEQCPAVLYFTGTGNTLILKGINTITSGQKTYASTSGGYGAAIGVSTGAALTITAAAGDSTASLTANGGYCGSGIGSVAEHNIGTITIAGGIIHAYGGTYGAGIGGGSGGSGGTINISGGTVNATGAYLSPGIGGGWQAFGSGCTINISGGTINASGGTSAAGIGSGSSSSNSNAIKISGGTITATGDSHAAGIGGGYGSPGAAVVINGGSVKATGGNGKSIGAGSGSSNDGSLKNGLGQNLYLNTLTLAGQSGTAITSGDINGTACTNGTPSGDSYGIRDMQTDSSGKVYFYLPATGESGTYKETIRLTADGNDYYVRYARSSTAITKSLRILEGAVQYWDEVQLFLDHVPSPVIDISALTPPSETYTFLGGSSKTVTLKGNGTPVANIAFTFGSNNTVTLENLNIQSGNNHADSADNRIVGYAPLSFSGPGNSLMLKENNTLTSGQTDEVDYYGAAISVPESAELTIRSHDGSSTPKLTVLGGFGGAGIGGGNKLSGGKVNILSGTLEITGGFGGAGIGGGWNGAGSVVNISGGIIGTTGGYSSAGIGSGNCGTDGGTLIISNGTVTASSIDGAGIGGGWESDGAVVTISGGSVHATGGTASSGIGGGYRGSGKSLTITGGTVVATGGYLGAGIGGGEEGAGGTVTISGGTITATGGDLGAGIGGGCLGAGGTVTISGGSVKATGVKSIGGGSDSSSDGTLKNGAGNNVYLNTLTVPAPAKSAVTSGSINGINCATGTPSGGAYGIKDVVTDEDQQVYFYLPISGSAATNNEVVRLTAGGTDYYARYRRTNAKITRALRSLDGAPLNWNEVQLFLDYTTTDIFDFSGFSTPSETYTFTVDAEKALTLKGNGTQINSIAFVFSGNNTVTIENLNIKSKDTHIESVRPAYAPLYFSGTGNTLVFNGDNVITSGQITDIFDYGAAVGVASDGELTIKADSATARLTVFGGNHGAGIGGGNDSSNGAVTLSGGIISANGGLMAAGIGGGSEGAGGTVTVLNGTITATGGLDASGIGGGSLGNGGDIRILGGTVKASGGVGRIGAGQGGTNQGTLRNGAGDNVYLNVFTIAEKANKAITEGSIDGVACIDGAPVGNAYSIKDVYTDAEGKVYLYLPATSEDNLVRLTADETTYGKVYTRTASENSQTLLIMTVVNVSMADAAYGDILEDPIATAQAGDGSFSFLYSGTGDTIYGPSIDKPTEAGSYSVTAIFTNSTHMGIGVTTFTIAPKTLDSDMITVNGSGLRYNATTQTSDVTVTDLGKILVEGVDYQNVSYTNNTNAGTATVSIVGKGNYSGIARKHFTIEKAPLTMSGAVISPKTYDGTAQAQVESVTFGGLFGEDTLLMGTDFTADGLFHHVDASANESVTISVSLQDTENANNYSISGSYLLTGQTIQKAETTGIDRTFNVVNRLAYSHSFNLDTLLPALENGKSFGDIHYNVTSVENTDGVLSAEPSGTATSPLMLHAANIAQAGKTATLTITISSGNYLDFTATLTVQTVDRAAVDISGIVMSGGMYNGRPFAYTGAPVFTLAEDGSPVSIAELDFLYTSTDGGGFSSGLAPVNHGSYVLTLTVPDSNQDYAGSASYHFTITKRSATVMVEDKTMTKGEAIPELTYTVSGQLSGESALIGAPKLYTAAKPNIVGSYPIMVDMTGVTYGANYMAASPAAVDGALTVVGQPVDDDNTHTPSGKGASAISAPPRSSNVNADGSISTAALLRELSLATTPQIVLRAQNARSISSETIRQVVRQAISQGTSAVLHADTLSGSTVQGRLYLPLSSMANINTGISLGIYTEPAKTALVTNLFERYFKNTIRAVCMEQQGSFGMRLQVAVWGNLSGLDTQNLIFYAHDTVTNTCRNISNLEYWVDANGYLHFYTSYGGYIIITDSPLTRR